MNNIPFPDPLRQAFRPDAPLISPALTQSPAQDLDRSQSWPKVLGEAEQVRHPRSQDPRGPAGRRYQMEVAGSGTTGSHEDSTLRFNSSSFLQNSHHDVDMLDAPEAPAGEPQVEEKVPPFPLPPRPPPTVKRKATLNDPSPAALPREPVQTEPYSLEPPQDAPKLFAGQIADFAPWSSDETHAEDQFNEQTITSGHWDKSHVSHEMGTARNVISSSIKHRSGLQILSMLFSSALKQRQVAGMVSPKSTFKPPPRVTLTDNRRETWLKDLADSNIPLRRLSRTIPQGIRGKALLDQCLAKSVPTWRAVWFVKCVGANEIRACKRNRATGAIVAGGEAKWIKDWTVQLQQFVEALVGGCGADDWQRSFTRGLQFVSHIYHEHLLDRDAFLEWLCGSLESASIDTTPIWLLVVKMYTAELVGYRKHARHLATALLRQYSQIVAEGLLKSLAYLRDQLATFVFYLMQSHSASFLLADSWFNFNDSLRYGASSLAIDQQQAFEKLQERNTNIVIDLFGETSPPRLMSDLIRTFDELPPEYDFRSLSDRCLQRSKHLHAVILTTLHWATTKYRFGLSRLYLAVRLIRNWSRRSIDLNQALFAFLETASGSCALVRRNVYKVVAELTRSKHFSVNRYLQWLMTRGFQKPTSSGTSDFYSEILDNIPCHDLPIHVHNLRVHILGAPDRQVDILSSAKSSIASRLSFMSGAGIDRDSTAAPHLPDLTGLWMNDFYEISSWMRKALIQQAYGRNDGDGPIQGTNTEPPLLAEDFPMYSKVLTHFQDYAFWADVLKMFIERGQRPVLAQVADSLNANHKIFHAIGAANDLFSRLLKRTSSLNWGLSERPLITSMIDLASVIPGKSSACNALDRDFRNAEHGSFPAAGSPVIDWVSDPTLNPDTNFLTLVDEVLRSGSSMDRVILERLFSDISTRIEMLWNGRFKLLPRFYELLPRLRFFDHEGFDELMLAWIEHILIAPRRPPLVAIAFPLVCNATSSLEQLLDRVLARVETDRANPILAVEALGLLVNDTELTDLTHLHNGPYVRAYRYHCQRRAILLSRTDLIHPLLSAVLDVRHVQEAFEPRIRKLVSQRAFPELMQRLLLSPAADAQHWRSTLTGSQAGDFAVQALNRVLFRSSVPTSEDAVVAVVQIADEFNATLCRVKLANLVAAQLTSNAATAQASKLADVLSREAHRSDGASLTVWREILPALTPDVLQKFHATAVARLFALMPTFASTSGGASLDYPETSHLDRLLGLISLAQEQSPASSGFLVLAQASDKLKALLLWLAKPAPRPSDAASALGIGLDPAASARLWLRVLLRLLAAHRAVLAHPKQPPATLARLAHDLALLLLQPAVAADRALAGRLFDFLAVLSDALAPDARRTCLRALCEGQRLRDPRLRFLFGTAGTAGRSVPLMLVGSAPLPASGAGSTAPDGQVRLDEARRPPPPPVRPFELSPWERLSNANPTQGENDTCISLHLFGARKAVL